MGLRFFTAVLAIVAVMAVNQPSNAVPRDGLCRVLSSP